MNQKDTILHAPAPFRVIGANIVLETLNQNYSKLEDIITQAYLRHHEGETINPDSYFLRYPKAPQNRIIALPAHIGGDTNMSGIKWIASYPDNIKNGLQRASAVLVLNNGETGYPIACLESGVISAYRTAISALVALKHLNKGTKKTSSVGIIGNGYIGKTVFDCLVRLDWDCENFYLFDALPDSSAAMAKHVRESGENVKVTSSCKELVANSKVVISTTTAPSPFILNPDWFSHHPIVLNLSLRDFSEDIILSSNNVLDDIDHCLKANTSPHLAYIKSGSKSFINGDIGDLILGDIDLDPDKTSIFSPFGLGVLDLALGNFVYCENLANEAVTVIEDFWGDKSRW